MVITAAQHLQCFTQRAACSAAAVLQQGLQPDKPRPFTHQAVGRQRRQAMTYAQALTLLGHRHTTGRVIHKLLLDAAQLRDQPQIVAKGIAIGQLLKARSAQFEQIGGGQMQERRRYRRCLDLPGFKYRAQALILLFVRDCPASCRRSLRGTTTHGACAPRHG